MEIKGIGINAHPDRVDGEIENLEADLKYFQDLGYDYVEISADAVDVIYNAVLRPQLVKDLKELLNRYSLKYTLHAPRVLDLRDKANFEVQKRLFQSCLELSRAIGAEVFVYHYGRRGEDSEAEEMLFQAMLEMAELAGELRVQICVENIEIDSVGHVVEFVRRVGREEVGMTLDVGHAFLSAHRFGDDFLSSIELAAPLVKHLHITDNFGKFEEARLRGYEQYKRIPYSNLLKLGKGDLHLPPGWGAIPLDEVLKRLPDYRGIFMLEYYFHRYKPYNREILRSAHAYVARHEDYRLTQGTPRGQL
jgi:sugar phosphate isomerase/epimerase